MTARTTPTRPRISMRSPADVIHTVPYLLGFHPAESIVLICLQGPAVKLTARMDVSDGPDTFSQLHQTVASHGDDALLVLYSELDAPAWLQEQALQFKDAMQVRAGRWFSLICDNPRCCPPGGTELPEAADSVVAATAVAAGLAPAASREDLTATLRPRQVTAAATEAALALSSIPTRDAAWLAIEEHATGDLDQLMAIAQQYLDIARHCPQDATACAPWFLYAWATWRTGSSARPNTVLDIIRAIDPTYAAAELLSHALLRAVDPLTTPPLTTLTA
jgi:hypothetical protein